MSDASELKPPVLLMAMPQVVDPFFHMSVVLLVHHQDDGSVGFIVNRPTGVPISAILNGLDIPWKGDKSHAAYFGGPVQPQFGTVIYRAEAPVDSESHVEIYPGVVMTQNIRDLATLAAKPPNSLRLFLGYAGWADGQLVEEIMRNDWMTAPVGNDLVFSDQPDQVWRSALESVGVNPAQLSTWTSDEGGSAAN